MKITPKILETTKTFKTSTKKEVKNRFDWWTAGSDKEMSEQMLSTAVFLKESQLNRQRKIAIFAKLYGNQSLFNFIGTSVGKLNETSSLPLDRPTFNLVQSCVDTVVSRIGQNKPTPVFLTDGSDYKQRNLAKKLNNFIAGEIYQTKSYEKAVLVLRDCLVTGAGIAHVYKNDDNKVCVERVLQHEIFVDPNESMYGDPRQIYRVKLVDRHVLMAMCPDKKSQIKQADQAFPDESADASKTVSDQVLVVEAWRLPSSKKSRDGKHVIACSAGLIFTEEYRKDKFPFVFMNFSPALLGFWPQGLTEQLTGTQMEINSILITISKSMKLVGVPRVFVEAGSKCGDAMFNDSIGAIIHYKGTKPEYSVAPCVPQELYAQLERLIQYGYQQSGVSAMQAGAQKPAGLDSGEAQRVYDDISTDRMATISKRYDDFFIDLAYQIIGCAIDIAKETGSYDTVFPHKQGTKQITLPDLKFLEDPFVIQCFNESSLPRDPAGRLQRVTEMIQSGMVSLQEGRRLLSYPDIEQDEKLANASQERIFQILDQIIEDGIYTPPDTFMDIMFANTTVVAYYNLYAMNKLEEEKIEMLRQFFLQVQDIKMEAMQPPPQAMPPNAPQAAPEPTPTSPLIPNGANPASAPGMAAA